MKLAACCAFPATFGLFWPVLLAAQDARVKSAEDHRREELGINAFTAPSIELVFRELTALRPIPFDKVWRDLPSSQPQSRAQLALTAGGVIADGFLAVAAEKQSRIEQVGRRLLNLSRGLGVGDHVTRHSRSILEKAVQNQWSGVQAELVRAQTDAEAGLMALKDEEIAHLVSFGGWLRGLEITAGVVAEQYQPARAARLVQPELLDYFMDRTRTLNPLLRATPPIQLIEKNLKQIRALTTREPSTPLTLREVKQIRDLAREMNKEIVKEEEP